MEQYCTLLPVSGRDQCSKREVRAQCRDAAQLRRRCAEEGSRCCGQPHGTALWPRPQAHVLHRRIDRRPRGAACRAAVSGGLRWRASGLCRVGPGGARSTVHEDGAGAVCSRRFPRWSAAAADLQDRREELRRAGWVARWDYLRPERLPCCGRYA